MPLCQPFTFPDTQQQVRALDVGGQPWFVVADVCAVLELTNPTMAASRVDEDDLSSTEVIDSLGRTQQARITNEAGLYELVFASRKPEARTFKRWVTHEVLPALRQTGTYSMGKTGFEIPPDYASALELAARKVRELELSEAKVAELEPAAAAWQNLATAYGDYAVADAAKILARDPSIKIGRDRLFRVMAEQRWTYRQGVDARWRAYQTAIETGRLCEAPGTFYHPRTGELTLDVPQVRVTVKGLEQLHRLLGGTAALRFPELEQPALL